MIARLIAFFKDYSSVIVKDLTYYLSIWNCFCIIIRINSSFSSL